MFVSGQLGGTGPGAAVDGKTRRPDALAGLVLDGESRGAGARVARAAVLTGQRYVAAEPGGAFVVVWDGRRVGYYATQAAAERVFRIRGLLAWERGSL